MALCKKCGIRIPCTKIIDGKTRNLCRRKYCLECSPFGAHNTRPLDAKTLLEKREEILTCPCGRQYVYDKQKGHGRAKCNSCVMNARRGDRKKWAIDYKGGKCVKCGYSKCSRSLVFHHLDPKDKDFPPNYGMNFSIKKLTDELDKCILICANCHGEVHDELNI